MRSELWARAALAASLCVRVATSVAQPGSPQQLENGSFLHPSAPVVDFGRVLQGTTSHASVTLHNSADWPLNLWDPEVSCGCVSAELAVHRADADASLELNVTLRPTQRLGPVHQTIRLRAEGFGLPLVTLDVTADIVPEFGVEPSVVGFDAPPVGQPAPRTLAIRWESGRHSVLGAYAVGDGMVRVEPSTTSEDLPGLHRFRVSVDRDPDAARQAAVLLLTTDPARPMVRVPIVVRRHPDTFRLEPAAVALMTTSAGEPATARIRIRSLDGSPASIVSVRDLCEQPSEVRLLGSPLQDGPGAELTTIGMRVDPLRALDHGDLELGILRGGATVHVRVPYVARVGAVK